MGFRWEPKGQIFFFLENHISIYTSDHNQKEAIPPMNKQATLKKGCALPVTEWHFKDKPGRHVGPMVEDFAQAFAYDKNDTTISVSNIKGVIMLAIQALQELVERQEKRIAELEMMMEKR